MVDVGFFTHLVQIFPMINCANPSRLNHTLATEISAAIDQVIRSENYILGQFVQDFEKNCAEFFGVEHSIGVASGTDALILSLMSHDIGRGDEVITVAHTAIATIAAINAVGAKAVLVDVNPKTLTLDYKTIEKAVTSRTKAIVPVHIYGHPAEMDEIMSIAKKQNLICIEDCSQAHGAKHTDRLVGSIGDIGCFSCYPTKNLGALGDAGFITCKDDRVAKRLKRIREYGWVNRQSVERGLNSRLDAIQASVLSTKLNHLRENNQERQKIASYYDATLSSLVKVPTVFEKSVHVFHLYVIRTQSRNSLKDFLAKNSINAGLHYPVPVHKQSGYDFAIVGNELPVTELACTEILSLPIYPGLIESEYTRVVRTIQDFFGNGKYSK